MFYHFSIKGIVSRDFGILYLFHWIDMKFVIGPINRGKEHLKLLILELLPFGGFLHDFSKKGAHDVKWGQLISIY
jgi:hypothetical protein